MKTYADLKASLQNKTHNKLGRIYDLRSAINDSVRSATQDVKMASLKRTQSTPTRLLDDIYEYPAPSDLDTLIDLQPVGERSGDLEWVQVMEQDFDRRKADDSNLVCVTEDSGTTALRISIEPAEEDQTTISTLDDTSAGGTIIAFGDATNVVANADFYVKGSGAVGFDAAGAGTTCGLTSTLTTAVDMTDYVNVGYAFAWAYLSTITGLSSVTLRIGNDSSNYYYVTSTTAHNGVAFKTGWNLVSFSFASRTETGSVTDASCDYWALYLNKTAVAQTGFVFDELIVGRGEQFSVVYYSKCPWQSSTGTWKTESTADTDVLNAGGAEYELILKKCAEELSGLVKEFDDSTLYGNQHKSAKENYQAANPDVSLWIEADSHRWESAGG